VEKQRGTEVGNIFLVLEKKSFSDFLANKRRLGKKYLQTLS
jgi:hypothetical protein